MHDAIRTILDRYECQSRDDYVNALREILQDVALLGLWRSKFFEHAAFYGGTALRVLHGLDRYSEDLDFSLLKPDKSFSLKSYKDAMLREIGSFGFHVEFETRRKTQPSAVESAFLKTNTYRQLMVIEAAQELLRDLHPAKNLKIRLEVDTDPPGGFKTETQYVLTPIPFSVRVYCLPDLLAGKLHAILCRRWKTRVKGRDWYDLVWYAARHREVRISHLESRMRQSGDYRDDEPLIPDRLQHLLLQAVDDLDVDRARREVAPFVVDQRALDVWSGDFFRQIIPRIVPI
ncbi:MAG: nucleotidyl transferase AbiEii/AbiGii toxin family protein [Thermodesulfobacteriota bacterium]|nr:nucleotidyl transferase AbiEii/AbiGii toxin family protein [Thermodesulfobacteriota bacterium]